MPLPRGWHAYAAAHFCKSLLWHFSGLLFAFFLTETCDLPPVTMGIVTGLALFGHAFADVVTGAYLRRRIACARSAIRVQARWSAAAAAFMVLFTMTPWVTPSLRIVVAGIALIAFRLTFAFMDVPQNALVPLLAQTPARQAHLLAIRNMLSGVASLIVALGATWLVFTSRAQAGCGYVAGAVLSGALLVAASWWLAAAPLPEPVRAVPPIPATVGGLPKFPLLLGLAGALVFASSAFRAMEAYAAAFAGAGTALMIWAAIGSILSQPFWLVVNRRPGSCRAPLLAGGWAAASAIVLLGPGRGTPVGMALAGLGFGIGSGGLWLMLWAFAMRHAVAGGGTWTIGLLTGISKGGQGAAMIGVGWVLAHSPYRTTFADPLSAPSLMMTIALLLIAACGVALAAISRTSPDAAPARRRPAVPRVRGPAWRRPTSYPARADPAAPAG